MRYDFTDCKGTSPTACLVTLVLFLSSSSQQNSAADLSMLVLEALEKSEAKVEEEILGKSSR